MVIYIKFTEIAWKCARPISPMKLVSNAGRKKDNFHEKKYF
jgi:hypothetical protein